jgi:DNA-binding HxlR family transcriptional regulator
MAQEKGEIFRSCCPSRPILDQIADKWSMLIVASLDEGPLRFNAVKRRLDGITQKALTMALRRLERNGLVERRIVAGRPVGVEYAITPLGRTLQPPFMALYRWTLDHMDEIELAQRRFDEAARSRGAE